MAVFITSAHGDSSPTSPIARADTKRLSRARAHYMRERDAASLLMLFQYLKADMPRTEVERILGAPDYSPIDGQYYYYASDMVCGHDLQVPGAPCGVIVEYRGDPDFTVLPTLQSCSFGSIWE